MKFTHSQSTKEYFLQEALKSGEAWLERKKNEDIVAAHQYLYYVLATPVWSDYEYDMFCRDNNIDSKGGSDLESSYTEEQKQLARKLLNR